MGSGKKLFYTLGVNKHMPVIQTIKETFCGTAESFLLLDFLMFVMKLLWTEGRILAGYYGFNANISFTF